MKKLITLTLLLAALHGKSQNVEEKKMLYEKDVAKSKLYEEQFKSGLSEQNFESEKIASSFAFPPDADNDGMPDSWESANGLNQNDPTDAWGDLDNDKVLNLFEYELGSNPNSASSPTTINVNAGTNVETALDNALPGQLVRIEAGPYLATYHTFLPKTIMIQGGWNSTFTNRDPFNTPTILDGHDSSEVLYFNFSSGNSNVVVDGITIINGKDFLGGFTFVAQGTAISNLCMNDCNILNSQSTFSFGGAVFLDHWHNSVSEVFFVKTLIANDSSSAIYEQTAQYAQAKWHVLNSTLTNNNSLDIGEGYGIRGFTLDSATININIINSIIRDNEIEALSFDQNGGPVNINAAYSDIDSLDFFNGVTYLSGTGMINANPLFVNPLSDYHLTGSSPCINTGINVGLPYAGSAPEMGVYEYATTLIENINKSSSEILVYPVPATDELHVQFTDATKESTVQIENFLGGKVYETTVTNKPSAILDVGHLQSGIYFIKLQNEKGTVVKKFVKE